MTRRLAAMTLIGQAMTISFGALVARQLAVADGAVDRGNTYLAAGLALAVLAVLASGLLRRPYGVTVGWVVQVLTLASAIVLPAMLFVVAIFGGLWVLSLMQGHKLDELSRQWAAEHAEDPATPHAEVSDDDPPAAPHTGEGERD